MFWKNWFGRRDIGAVVEATATPATVAVPLELGPHSLSPDQPIVGPDQDLFGYDPFARAIAAGIAGIGAPEGQVVGVHGPWGSGKSSAVNLVKHNLRSGQIGNTEDLVLVEFNPWWFNGSDALAMAFFSELGAAIGKSLPEKAQAVFRSLGRKLGSASGLVEAAVNLTTAGAGGSAAGGALKSVSDLLGTDRSVQDEHAVLVEALRKSQKRFLVVIDDLDRLGPDDALLIFKLVKSVGRLPNLMYLLVFDRALTEASVAERFPSEGAHFLEKIVQASFELPPPEHDDLRNLLLANVARIMCDLEEAYLTRFMNLFYDVVAPDIARARDVIRLTNALEVTWPAVAGDVNKADFLAIEALRLSWPKVYRAVYDNMTLVCGHALDIQPHAQAGEQCDLHLLSDVAEADRPRLRKALMRLFPALENAWSNHYYAPEFALQWRRDRRVCVAPHFPTYFRFAPSSQVTTATEIESFIAGSGDVDFVRKSVLDALGKGRRGRGTHAATLLDELNFRASDVPLTSIEPLVVGLFSIADDLNVEADASRGFSIGDNSLRLHWLLNRLLADRLVMSDRDALFEKAAERATLLWLVDFVLRCKRQYDPEHAERDDDGEPLVSAVALDRLVALALSRVEEEASDGRLIQRRDLVSRLFRWRDLGEDLDSIKSWVSDRLDDDEFVVALARGSLSTGWSHVMGDAVARRYTRLDRGALEKLVEPVAFLRRVASLLGDAKLDADKVSALTDFETAWTRSETGDYGD